MTPKQIIKFLNKKGLEHGDVVTFRVENQISGGYYGPNIGILILEDCNKPFILCTHSEKALHMSIDEGYDAYSGTIEKFKVPVQTLDDGALFNPEWLDNIKG